jgi:hypothetical protein
MYFGTCPACGRYILAGRSKIIPVPADAFRAEPPRYYSHYDAETDQYMDGQGGVVRRPRIPYWMHASCEPRLRGSSGQKYVFGLALAKKPQKGT